MNRLIAIGIGCLLAASTVNAQYGRCSMTDKPIGFCILEGGTTGGEGGRMVRVSSHLPYNRS